MNSLVIKSLHIIFIVTWFAGLFYVPRLFIYQTEAQSRPQPDRDILTREYKRNTRLLWQGITWPSALLTLVFGFWLLYTMSDYLKLPFMQVKLVLVAFLYVYQFANHLLYRQLQRDTYPLSSFQLRLWNEVATVLLVGIVFLIVMKNAVSWLWGILGIVAFALLLVIAIRLYKKVRDRSSNG